MKLTQNSLERTPEKVVIDLRIERRIEPEAEAMIHMKKQKIALTNGFRSAIFYSNETCII
jgi:hypothetical protein